MKVARSVSFKLKQGMEKQFNQVVTGEVLPILQKQKGFMNELVMFNGGRGLAISVWDDAKHAELYQSATYPEVLKKLTPMVEGTPEVRMFEVAAVTTPVAA